MNQDERDELQRKRIEATVRREEWLASKYEAETNLAIAELENIKNAAKPIPFYRRTSFLRPVAAGISLALIFAAYFQYVFLPTQNRLEQKAESAEFQLQQSKAEHSANLAQVNLIKEQINIASKDALSKLNAAIASLEKAKRQNELLSSQIDSLKQQVKDQEQLKELKRELEQNNRDISSQLGDAQESKSEAEVFVEVAETFAKPIAQDGWIYVGYYPGDKWQYRTLKVNGNNPVEPGEEYEVVENVNVRDSPPEFSIFGYKYGLAKGVIKPPKKVRIQQTDEVGRSKVWAKVVTVDP